ncbi:MAG TPA: hypothetical protein VGQ35_08240 [Dongiaceae bacterium]|jgi:hypothetical protein|nr:hypothetical protein [Dongiaceae bacterium]
MNSTKVQFHSVPGTDAAMGWVGGHSIVGDRPAGIAGGQGLGFSDGQLLGLAIGGVIRRAREATTVGNSLPRGIGVTFAGGDQDAR